MVEMGELIQIQLIGWIIDEGKTPQKEGWRNFIKDFDSCTVIHKVSPKNSFINSLNKNNIQ